jgi:hypothetical protein
MAHTRSSLYTNDAGGSVQGSGVHAPSARDQLAHTPELKHSPLPGTGSVKPDGHCSVTPKRQARLLVPVDEGVPVCEPVPLRVAVPLELGVPVCEPLDVMLAVAEDEGVPVCEPLDV